MDACVSEEDPGCTSKVYIYIVLLYKSISLTKQRQTRDEKGDIMTGKKKDSISTVSTQAMCTVYRCVYHLLPEIIGIY